MKKRISEFTAEKLDIDKGILMNIPRLTFSGNRELTIENYRNITEYSPEVIRIKTPDYILKIEGVDLKLSYISREDLQISGIFSRILFEH